MKGLLGVSLLPLLVTATPVLKSTVINGDAAPLISSVNAQEIPNSYIIKLKSHVDHSLFSQHQGWVHDLHKRSNKLRKRSQVTLGDSLSMVDNLFGGLKHTYNIAGSMMGYSGHFDDEVIEAIRNHPDVELVERDQEVHTLSSDSPSTEKSAPWGLARISHRKSLNLGTFNKYLYASDGGEGVDVYVIDTGTNVDHVDFEGRAAWGKTIPTGDADEDGNGHGTHCSGTVAGKKYGVAKKANVIAVKVLRSNGSGSMSDVVKGVEYAAESHSKAMTAAKKGKKKGFKGSAANMSLGGGKSTILDQAVNAAVDAGIHFAVAAGNDNADSCNYSPAAAQKAVTVGASNIADERAFFSNYGKCNDIFAPGLNIQSTWIGSKYAVNTISGTSMASPHIAGLLAYMLSLQPSKDSAYAVADIKPAKLKAHLLSIGTLNALTQVPSDTANVLAWNGGGSSNYSSIIEEGSYTIPSRQSETLLDELESKVEKIVPQVHKSAEQVKQALETAFEEFLEVAVEQVKSHN